MELSSHALCSNCRCPLMWTFAFPGAEYWCPKCHCTFGAFDVDRVPFTWKNHNRLWHYKNKFNRYLRARGILQCSEFRYHGKWIPPAEIPKAFRTRLKNIVEKIEGGRK